MSTPQKLYETPVIELSDEPMPDLDVLMGAGFHCDPYRPPDPG